jgi:hypothetical protein
MKAYPSRVSEVKAEHKNLWDGVFTLLPVLLLPLAGVALSGRPVEDYLEFPPTTQRVAHAPFSFAVFALTAVIILAGALILIKFAVGPCPQNHTSSRLARPFPWWGWLALALNVCFWIIAWSRFDWCKDLQAHTFTPLWATYIIAVNALCVKEHGTSLMTARPFRFICLFPGSALFWWIFEYLNRFVENWHYSEIGNLGTFEYVAYATISFSTVLPAVLSTQVLICNSSSIKRYCGCGRPASLGAPRIAAWLTLAISCLSLLLIGVFSDYLFPLLWVSPLAALVSIQSLRGRRHILSSIAEGDWRTPVSAALAALCCGWFWEMWNYYSLAKWYYTIPFVDGLRVFEMPLLGYAGYLPFGLECAAVGYLLDVRAEDLQLKESS